MIHKTTLFIFIILTIFALNANSKPFLDSDIFDEFESLENGLLSPSQSKLRRVSRFDDMATKELSKFLKRLRSYYEKRKSSPGKKSSWFSFTKFFGPKIIKRNASLDSLADVFREFKNELEKRQSKIDEKKKIEPEERRKILGEKLDSLSFDELSSLYQEFEEYMKKRKQNGHFQEKFRTFISERIGDKPISALPGIGSRAEQNLMKKGYDKIYKVLGQFLLLGKNKESFEKWLVEKFNTRASGAMICYKSLLHWTNKFL